LWKIGPHDVSGPSVALHVPSVGAVSTGTDAAAFGSITRPPSGHINATALTITATSANSAGDAGARGTTPASRLAGSTMSSRHRAPIQNMSKITMPKNSQP
jgi:hypothetical protein